MGRRQFTPEFKTKIVVELLREEKPLGELAAEHEISPNQLRNWKREFLENATRVFSESKQEKELRAKEAKELMTAFHDTVSGMKQMAQMVDVETGEVAQFMLVRFEMTAEYFGMTLDEYIATHVNSGHEVFVSSGQLINDLVLRISALRDLWALRTLR